MGLVHHLDENLGKGLKKNKVQAFFPTTRSFISSLEDCSSYTYRSSLLSHKLFAVSGTSLSRLEIRIILM